MCDYFEDFCSFICTQKKATNINHSLHQRTPFHVAVEGGHLGLVKYFLGKQVDINIKESFGVSALRTSSLGKAACHGMSCMKT